MNDNLDGIISRRSFLRRGSCAALGLAGLTGQVFAMRSMAAAIDGASFGDYKALVCVFLFGGNDSGNTLIPFDGGNENWAEYATARTTLALTQEQAAANVIAPLNTGGRRFAMHPALGDLRQLFDQGNLAFVANVGTLLEPTNKQQYEDRLVKIPSQLFAHNVQQEQWQLSKPDAIDGLGWGGRIADMLQANGANPDASVSMNISLSGSSLFLTGNQVTPYGIDNLNQSGADTNGLGSTSERQVVQQALLDLHAAQQDPLHPNPHAMRKVISDITKRSIVTSQTIAELTAGVTFTTPKPPGGLANQLERAAKLIAIGQTGLSQQRQLFFVSTGGFDNHDGLIGTDATDGAHAGRLTEVNNALRYFWDVLGELGMRDSVTTFTASDFGRTFRSNGDGSDHAWAGHHMVMGGSQVNGKRVFGEFPIIQPDGPSDVGKGRFIPTTSVEEYGFELARWMGVPLSETPTVFPHVSRFMDINNPATHLGVLA